MALLEKAGAQAALAHVERSLLERRIFRVHADRLKAIIEELGVL